MPSAEESTRIANERPLTRRLRISVKVSTGEEAVLTAVPLDVLEYAAPGSVLAFRVNVACGLARLV